MCAFTLSILSLSLTPDTILLLPPTAAAEEEGGKEEEEEAELGESFFLLPKENKKGILSLICGVEFA